jgi:hypothetical protein
VIRHDLGLRHLAFVRAVDAVCKPTRARRAGARLDRPPTK